MPAVIFIEPEFNDPANAQALHSVVMKVASDHPDLLAGPGWDKLTDYVKAVA